ncbi:MAG: hypothetical protein ACJAY5_000085 [Actinomycetes bacterium]
MTQIVIGRHRVQVPANNHPVPASEIGPSDDGVPVPRELKVAEMPKRAFNRISYRSFLE